MGADTVPRRSNYLLQRAYGVTVSVCPAPRLPSLTMPTAVHVLVLLGNEDTSTALFLLSDVVTSAPPPKMTFPEAHDAVAVTCVVPGTSVAPPAEVALVPTTRVASEGPAGPVSPAGPVEPVSPLAPVAPVSPLTP